MSPRAQASRSRAAGSPRPTCTSSPAARTCAAISGTRASRSASARLSSQSPGHVQRGDLQVPEFGRVERPLDAEVARPPVARRVQVSASVTGPASNATVARLNRTRISTSTSPDRRARTQRLVQPALHRDRVATRPRAHLRHGGVGPRAVEPEGVRRRRAPRRPRCRPRPAGRPRSSSARAWPPPRCAPRDGGSAGTSAMAAALSRCAPRGPPPAPWPGRACSAGGPGPPDQRRRPEQLEGRAQQRDGAVQLPRRARGQRPSPAAAPPGRGPRVPRRRARPTRAPAPPPGAAPARPVRPTRQASTAASRDALEGARQVVALPRVVRPLGRRPGTRGAAADRRRSTRAAAPAPRAAGRRAPPRAAARAGSDSAGRRTRPAGGGAPPRPAPGRGRRWPARRQRRPARAGLGARRRRRCGAPAARPGSAARPAPAGRRSAPSGRASPCRPAARSSSA